jgi:hypothetical protein
MGIYLSHLCSTSAEHVPFNGLGYAKFQTILLYSEEYVGKNIARECIRSHFDKGITSLARFIHV